MSNHQTLEAWQQARVLTSLIYELTDAFPRTETYRLTDKMRRAAISITSNIAEGSRKRTRAAQFQFMSIAFGSTSELESQVILTEDLCYGTKKQLTLVDACLQRVLRLLNGLCRSLQCQNSQTLGHKPPTTNQL